MGQGLPQTWELRFEHMNDAVLAQRRVMSEEVELGENRGVESVVVSRGWRLRYRQEEGARKREGWEMGSEVEP